MYEKRPLGVNLGDFTLRTNHCACLILGKCPKHYVLKLYPSEKIAQTLFI